VIKKDKREDTARKPDLKRNNLDRSSSPYLRQHLDNPVWWQEWGGGVLQEAARQNKPLFVSVGYSTCHWCHVMANEAFSDPATAEFLNQNFVCIKVDRETRPDIDQHLMQFMQAQSGGGGWPLNVFLAPDLRPIFALTYAPAIARGGMLPLRAVAGKVLEYFIVHSDEVRPFALAPARPEAAPEGRLPAELLAGFDPLHGGFGLGAKFPPHSTLLYMLYRLCVEAHPGLEHACRLTLDAMRRRGLHDHLQGGIFRYCVDREWTIPHFEKMLYDQALALWSYSLAHKALGDAAFRETALGVIRCLEETFAMGDLFATAIDADTEHHEGATYVWRAEEIRSALTAEEYRRFASSYRLPEKGNFEGAIHLIRGDDRSLGEIEGKLLALRRGRMQPFRDEKILCGINALTACALVQAGRLLGCPALEEKAARTVKKLLAVFWDGSVLAHSLFCEQLQRQGFLSDAGALLLAVTMLRESADGWQDAMSALAGYTASFKREGGWVESSLADFQEVPASWFDHPVPSSVSLAVLALERAAVLDGAAPERREYLAAHQSDFYNVAAMFTQGLFHHVHSPRPLDWLRLPANSIQIRDNNEADCYRGSCRPLEI